MKQLFHAQNENLEWKLNKLQENKSALPKRHDVLSYEIVLGLKRRLRLDDTIAAKKIKQVECCSGD
jgi:hypothetical protein